MRSLALTDLATVQTSQLSLHLGDRHHRTCSHAQCAARGTVRDDSHSMQYRTLSASFSMKSKQTWPDMGCAAQHFCTHFRICAHTA